MSCKASGSNTAIKADGEKKGLLGGLFCKKNVAAEAENKQGEFQCPPMPCFDVGECRPGYLCNPFPPTTKTYAAPKGVKIVPISKGGRSGSGTFTAKATDGKCQSCGKPNDPKPTAPCNIDCPIMKPRCPNVVPKDVAVEKKDSGFFGKIASLFAGKTEGEPEEEKCPEPDSEEALPFQFVNGKPVYEGGMSLDRAERFLWAQGTCDGEGFRLYGIMGQNLKENSDEPECTCEEHMKKYRYKGGQSLDDVLEWLWIKNKNLKPSDSDAEAQPADAE